MDNIKSLYLTAKSSGKQKDIDKYIEAVHYLLENKPSSYIHDIEYIISSNIGLSTLKEFVDKYGLSIASYDKIMTYLEDAVRKYGYQGRDSTMYKETINMMESFKDSYPNNFILYETFKDKMPDDYVDQYYGRSTPLIENLDKLFSRYGMGIIPDTIVECVKNNTIDKLISIFENSKLDPTNCQWIIECMKDIDEFDEAGNAKSKQKLGEAEKKAELKVREEYDKVINKEREIAKNNFGVYNPSKEEKEDLEKNLKAAEDNSRRIRKYKNQSKKGTLQEKSLEGIVESIKTRTAYMLREAAFAGVGLDITYSPEETKAIEDLISFKEYMVTCVESVEERDSLTKEIYSLYEYIDKVEEDVADNVAPMLPSTPIGISAALKNESLTANTSNKRTGQVPDYLRTNHDLGYGEDDDIKKKPESDEPTLDDFKRPSANQPTPIPSEDNQSPEKTIEDLKDDIEDAKSPEEKQQAINNYYYYTYQNSFNKSKNVDQSTGKAIDDHSMNKRVHSNDIHGESDETKTESWELEVLPLSGNYFREDNMITEATNPNDAKPESDHPIRDTLMDIDRKMTSGQQAAKKVVQDAQNVVRVFTKPARRTSQWVTHMVRQWKDKDENTLKERMADPHARSSLFKAIRIAIVAGSLLKAGILLHPVFLVLAGIKGITGKGKKFRLRNEMVGELKAEIEIIDEKIKDADRANDNRAKYQLMRLKNEINKKLIRVGGTKDMAKIL